MTQQIDYIKIAKELNKNSTVFEHLLKDIAPNEYLWKPNPEKWCLLEIICHLYDEEREDFRARTKHTLETPTEPLPSIAPQGWVESRKYIQANYAATLDNFLKERAASVQWLQTLSAPKWENAYLHPKFGEMTAKMFLSNWLAHDYLHIKQILYTKFEYLKQETEESLVYAGAW